VTITAQRAANSGTRALQADAHDDGDARDLKSALISTALVAGAIGILVSAFGVWTVVA
jgi:uncharacterized protein YgbK (DUF1537 family)